MNRCVKCNKSGLRYSDAFSRARCSKCKAIYTVKGLFIDYDPENEIICDSGLFYKNRVTGKTYPEVTLKIIEPNDWVVGSLLFEWFRKLPADEKRRLFKISQGLDQAN